MVEDKVKDFFGGDKDEDEDDKEGGFFSNFLDRDGDEEKLKKMREKQREKDEDEDDKKGGFFSKFLDRDEDKDKDDDKDHFFSKIFNRDDDDDDKGKEKQSGFSGLFSELEGPSAAGGYEGGDMGGVGGGGGCGGQTIALNDGGMYGQNVKSIS